MKISTQLLSLKKQGKGDSVAVFGCSAEDIMKLTDYVEDVTIKYWIESAKDESIVGNVYSLAVNAGSSQSKSKFTIKSPESENLKTSQLSALVGQELELNIDFWLF